MAYANATEYNCLFCPRKFSEGRFLKHHVKTDHPEIGAMLRALLPQIEKENEEMALPNAGAPRQGGRGGDGGNQGTGLPYLKADNLTTEPKEARILMVRYDAKHRFGPSVVVKLEMEDKFYLWTLNINNNPNFATLRKQFGGDENEWVDKRILLLLEQDKFSESFNIRTRFPKK